MKKTITFFNALLLTIILFAGSGNIWGAEGDVVFKINGATGPIATGSSYTNYGPASVTSAVTSTVSTASWKITCGNKSTSSPVGLWLGSNSGGASKLILNTGGFAEASGIATAIGKTATTTSLTALVGETSLPNVAKVNLSYSATGGTAPTQAWVLYSTDNGTTWSVAATTTTVTSGYNFTFTTIASARYAVVFYGTAWFNVRIPVLTFYEGSTGSSSPTISVTESSVPAMSAEVGTSDAEVIHVGGTNLTGNISLDITDDANGLFSVLPTSLTQTGGAVNSTDVTVTYTPTAAGSHTATLTISSTGATDKTFTLAGSATYPPLATSTANDASDVTATGFTASWSTVSGATSYDLSVYTKTAGANATDLFISEYIEAAPGNRKAIQIFNGTGADVTLTDVYSLKLGVNGAALGSATNSTIALTGTVAAGDVFVIAYGTDGGYTTNQVSTYLNFNGDDAIGLFKNNELLDVFGTPGTDPGTGWAIGGTANATVDHIITRNTSVMSPVTTWNTDEWTLGAAYTNATGDAAAAATLTSHSFAGGSTSTPISGSPFIVTETSKVVSGLNPGTEYFYTVVAKNASGSSAASNEISVTTPKITFTGTGEWTETARWNTGAVPGATAQVVVDGAATINSDVEVAGLTINAGKSLTVNSAKQLTISGIATNNGTITIQSDANGTGTIVGDVTGNATVNQYLKGDYRTWYLSSPVANAQPANLGWIKYYNEADGSWPTLFDARTSSLVAYGSNSFVTAKGYLVVPSTSAVANANIQFAGELNTGNKSIALTNSVTNTSKPGFNLVGNPYPSYLKWADVYAANKSKLSSASIWYRTKQLNEQSQLEYMFWTVNGDGVVTPLGVSASSNIPPMQAFWVKTTTGGGTLELTNNMRSHANATGFLLKAPAVDTRTLIRLQVSNGTNTDEAVLYLSDNANNGLDAFDAPKMTNDNASIAEIFTRAGNEKLVINAMRTLPRDTEIALGFEAGSATTFTLRANELSNLPSDVQLILKDNVTKAETDMTDGTAVYSFSNIATSGDRFSIIFRTAGAVTGIDQPDFSGLTAYSNANNQLTVLYDGVIDAHTVVSVYNAVGQRLVTQSLKGASTIVDGAFTPGVYVVKVNNLSRKLTIKN